MPQANKLTRALVRRPSPQYAAYYARRDIHISDSIARSQHDAYISALEDAGIEVTALPPHPTHHDCVFIEDTAIVWGDQALITRMNDIRNGEQQDVEKWLSGRFEVVHVPADARIEGGDVLHLEDLTLVGRSARTNDAGITALRAFMKPHGHDVIAVDVARCLHLKSAMTYLGDRAILISAALVDFDVPAGYRTIDVDLAEPDAGNVLRLNDVLLSADGFPKTAEKLREFAMMRKLRRIELDISEARKGDGALTCQSLLF